MFTENLDAFLDTDELAVSAVYDAAGANTTVKVLFDRSYQDPLSVANARTVVTGKASDFPAATDADPGCVGKTLGPIGGVTYTIRTREPIDDGAFVLLQLTV